MEDDRDAREGLSALLSYEGFSVVSAEDGAEAVDILSNHTQPDLIILDLVLPKATGWELLKYFQADSALRHVPVIVMTGLSEDGARVVGADAVMRKPVDVRALMAEIIRLLGLTAS